jgi:hypothetical protein
MTCKFRQKVLSVMLPSAIIWGWIMSSTDFCLVTGVDVGFTPFFFIPKNDLNHILNKGSV